MSKLQENYDMEFSAHLNANMQGRECAKLAVL